MIALTLDDNDELIGVHLTRGDDDVLIATRKGLVIRFPKRMYVRWGEQPEVLKESIWINLTML